MGKTLACATLLFACACSHTKAENDRAVIDQMTDQYEIAKGIGDKSEMCKQAGWVAAAYLQSGDGDNYKLWKDTETNDCAAAQTPTY